MQRLGQLALAGALGVTLCSCAQQQARMAAQPQAQITATNGEADAQCQSYGATPGTPAYNECRANVEAAINRGVGYKSNMWGDARTNNKDAGF
jgi:hypothetical protein